MTLKRTIELLKEYLKMNNIIELTDTTKPSSSERANKYRLDEINKIRYYFDTETKERKDIIKKLNKYLVSFDYLDKIFTKGTGISKSLLKLTKKRKKKHNKIIAFAKNKLNTIDTLLSSALNDSKISHEDFTNIITEKNIYENIKENIKNTLEPTELPSIAELTREKLTAL